MKNKKRNIKSIILTVFLLFSLAVVIYTCIGIFISGPAIKYEEEQESIHQKIASKKKGVTHIYKHSFQFVTYIAETNKQYLVYDKNAKQIATRTKIDAKFEEAKQAAIKKDAIFIDIEATIGYGYEEVVYTFENGNTMLLLDYETLDEIFYMKEDR